MEPQKSQTSRFGFGGFCIDRIYDSIYQKTDF